MQRFEDLVGGFARFRSKHWAEPRFRDLVERGQQPAMLAIGCSDSRVDLALLFDTAPGDLFTIRNVANIVPPHAPDARLHGVSSAIEFAVTQLKVRHVVVVGHSGCGGIRALVEGRPLDTTLYLDRWVNIAADALRDLPDGTLAERCTACERANVLLSLERLRTFPFVAEPLAAGTLSLHGLWVDLTAGRLHRHGAGGWSEVG
jgi:carbonic anhydrase